MLTIAIISTIPILIACKYVAVSLSLSLEYEGFVTRCQIVKLLFLMTVMFADSSHVKLGGKIM